MSKRLSALLLLAAMSAVAAPKKPRLVLFIVVDQCRYDYLTRYASEFTGGLKRLLKKGANFTNANDDFFPTLTATSHATLLTGAMASATGIVGNEWFDRDLHKHVTSVSDTSVHLVGAETGEGASPHRLLVPGLGDELKKADARSRVYGISIKDRSAILLGGLHPDGAYWFDEHSGGFVTSSYYASALPAWVRAFNDAHVARNFFSSNWLGHQPATYREVERGPFGDELTEMMAERAIKEERLGKGPATDLLALSLPGMDYAGHDYGPNTPESHETLLRADRTLEKLFQTVDREVGLSSTLIVLTSDHGIPPLPAVQGGISPLSDVTDRVQRTLAQKYGPGKWVDGCWDVLLYLNTDLIAEEKLDRAEVNRTAAEALRSMPHIARAYTREELMNPHSAFDETGRRMKDGFHATRGADIEFLPDEFWVFTSLRTTHGSTWSYDSHVPLIFMGSGIAPAVYEFQVRSNDIAPTLAKIIGVPVPPASVGHVIPALY